MINFLLTSKKPLSVSFKIEAENSASVVDGRVRRQSALYEPNLPRTQALLKVSYSPCPPRPPWLNILLTPRFYLILVWSFVRPAGPIDQKNKEMQNKPNLCPFYTKNHDSTKKQTQFKPNSNPFLPPKTPLKAKTNPNKPNPPTKNLRITHLKTAIQPLDTG